MSPTLNQDTVFGDRQFMVITSEKQCRIVALPSQNCVYRLQITDTDFVVRAEVVSMKGKVANNNSKKKKKKKERMMTIMNLLLLVIINGHS